MKMTVGLFNESFPPVVDGVANVVKNYAYWINKNRCRSIVVTPKYPKAADDYSFEVNRYVSMTVPTRREYRFGFPMLDSVIWRRLKKTDFDIVHSHSPFGAGLAARQIAKKQNIPFVTTFHSKFRDDFKASLKSDTIVNGVIQKIVKYYESADEVWVVNDASVETLRDYGYKGDVHIMGNGCDISLQHPTAEALKEVNNRFSLNPETPLFMYIGQHIWQKNLQMVLESLKLLHDKNPNFHMLFVGDGAKRSEMEQMTKDFGLENNITFAGKIFDRNLIAKIYLRSSAMLFPSMYDTSSLVPKEAAACGCPTVFVKGTSTAQGITDKNGFLIENNAQSLAEAAEFIIDNPEKAKAIGDDARETVYYSWKDAVGVAMQRYEYLIDLKKNQG